MIVLAADLNVGELYDPALKVETSAEAHRYFEALVERRIIVDNVSRAEAFKIEAQNVNDYAFMCGCYDIPKLYPAISSRRRA